MGAIHTEQDENIEMTKYIDVSIESVMVDFWLHVHARNTGLEVVILECIYLLFGCKPRGAS